MRGTNYSCGRYPDLVAHAPGGNLVGDIVTMVDPEVLLAAGLPVFRAVQQAGQFVVTFPRACVSGRVSE